MPPAVPATRRSAGPDFKVSATVEEAELEGASILPGVRVAIEPPDRPRDNDHTESEYRRQRPCVPEHHYLLKLLVADPDRSSRQNVDSGIDRSQ